MSAPRPKLPRPTTWLWWTAFLVLVAGLAVNYLFRMQGPEADSARAAGFVLAATAVLCGICVICATAGAWLRR
jgi:hypothetical protein